MRWQEIEEAVTKAGLPIDFKFFPNIEDENRGFVLHELKAYVGGQQVGFLKVDYIDSAEAKRLWKDGIYNWIEDFGGTLIYPYKGAKSIDELSIDEMNGFIKKLPLRWGWYDSAPSFETVEQAKEWLHTVFEKKDFFKDLKKKYKDFCWYHIDKPKVAFISVERSEINGNKLDYTRQGVATALYLEMCRILHGMGLKFYASTLQQPGAAAVWDKMTENGWVSRDKRGRYLDPAKIPSETITEDVAKARLPQEGEKPFWIEPLADITKELSEFDNWSWTTGGCFAFAEVLHSVIGGMLCGIAELDDEDGVVSYPINHAMVKKNGHYYDFNGVVNIAEYCRYLEKRRHVPQILKQANSNGVEWFEDDFLDDEQWNKLNEVLSRLKA